MGEYRPPLDDILFLVEQVFELQTLPGGGEVGAELAGAILGEGARWCAERLAPSNAPADRQGVALTAAGVRVPAVLADLYAEYRAGGWPTLVGDPAHGGQGLPHLLGFAFDEMVQGANLSFSLLPMLSAGVVTALERFGSEAQRALYVPRLVSGEWAGTMNLTEAAAGSDLAAVATRAEPRGDHYLLRGQKIFISWGDHQLTENIVHLVLARTPDAPPGVRGISLFIVPKYRHDADGRLGERNDVRVVGIEHKLGLHASPTCVLGFGEEGQAVGYLVGEENQGLAYMFAMMNHARLAVGLQGVAVAERAYQQALAHARERRQGGRAIVEYPDVRRMLLTMKALTQGGRALAYAAVAHWDRAAHQPDAAARAYHQRRVDLLTPLVKAWCTEIGTEVASLGIQVHGGMVYIEEAGAAQFLRDVRIAAIYEGTNGIQAMDLVGRKLLRDGGAAAQELFADLDAEIARASGELAELATAARHRLEQARRGVALLLAGAGADPQLPGSIAFPLLMLLATTVVGSLLLRAARLSLAQGQGPAAQARVQVARFFFAQIAPRNGAWLEAIASGSAAIMAPADVHW
ncbi:MAG: acyl-CoA dehydrogenase [Pseudomonadales bacterium]|nr:acyl-CoA dehydrogenase [Pseudomonadales bacterium]